MSQTLKTSVTVVMNTFRRESSSQLQLRALQKQTVKPSELLLWGNSARNLPREVLNASRAALTNHNFGVWARFAYALNAQSEFVCVLDDDTFPGSRWLENCLETFRSQPGLLGTRGMRFIPGGDYMDFEEVGWKSPNETVETVDLVGHAWFFRREWLRFFWASLDHAFDHPLAGEDLHFSYALQEYGDLGVFVPPHPREQPELWGSNPRVANTLGSDESAISRNPFAGVVFRDALQHYRDLGFTFVLEKDPSSGELRKNLGAATQSGLHKRKVGTTFRRLLMSMLGKKARLTLRPPRFFRFLSD